MSEFNERDNEQGNNGYYDPNVIDSTAEEIPDGQYEKAEYILHDTESQMGGQQQDTQSQYTNAQQGQAQYSQSQYNQSQYDQGNSQGQAQYSQSNGYAQNGGYNQSQYSQANQSQNQANSQYGYQNGNAKRTSFTSSKPRRKRESGAGKVAKLVAAGLVFGLVAGVAFQGVNIVSNKINPTKTTKATLNTVSTIETSSSDSDSSSTSSSVAAVAKSAMPSIVSITSVVEETVDYGWFGSQTQESTGSGSGIILSEDDDYLYIATNNHVVEDAKSVSIGFCDNKTADAEIKGTDSDADLAVVAVKLSDIDSSTKKEIKVAVLGDSDKIQVGETAIAIGNALGYGQSVTSGCISATEREVALTDKTMTLIQTDAAINPGNSGGALLNAKGEVIGINTVKVSSTTIEGMGYAIPISDAKSILESLIENGTVPESEQAYLGISGRNITSEYANSFGMPTGIYVVEVQEDSPAEKAGLYTGDIITKIDDTEVSDMEALINKLGQKKSGDSITLTIKRQSEGEYKEQTVKVTLGSKADMPSTTATTTESSTSQSQNGSSYGNGYGNSYGYGYGYGQ